MKGLSIERFGGINIADPKDTLKDEECTDLINVRLTRESLVKRSGTTAMATTGLSNYSERGLYSVRGVLMVAENTAVLKWNSTAWVASGITGINASALPVFIEFPAASTSDTDTGTSTSVLANGYGIVNSSKSYTINAYVGYYLKMTSGDASGQLRVITANTETEVFVADPFDPAPSLGDTYSIIAKIDASTYFFDGVTQPKKNLDITTTTWTSITNMQFVSKYFKFACVYNNRIVGVLPNSPDIYVSSLQCGESYPYRITVGDANSYIKGIGVLGNQLVIHKGMEDGVWITEFTDPTQAQLVQRAENFAAINFESIAVGENIQFFVSDRGIEWFNPLETNMLEGQKSLSSYRIPALGDLTTYDVTNSKACTFDAKYICILKHKTSPSVANNRVFIFDTGIYLQRLEEGKSKPYTFLIDKGYQMESICVHNGELYLGGTGKVYKYTGATDDGTAITAYWEKDGIHLGMKQSEKVLRKVLTHINTIGTTETMTLTASAEIQSKTLATVPTTKRKIKTDGKRTRGYSHKIKLDISNLTSSIQVESMELIYEKGTI